MRPHPFLVAFLLIGSLPAAAEDRRKVEIKSTVEVLESADDVDDIISRIQRAEPKTEPKTERKSAHDERERSEEKRPPARVRVMDTTEARTAVREGTTTGEVTTTTRERTTATSDRTETRLREQLEQPRTEGTRTR
jgi:hypothetical protein